MVQVASDRNSFTELPSGAEAALLVLLARSAGAGIVAADLGARPHERRYRSMMMVAMMMVVMMMVVMAAAARIVMSVIGSMVVGRLAGPDFRLGAHRLGLFPQFARLI